MKNIEVYFDNASYSIVMEDNSVAAKLTTMLKHLNRLPLRLSAYDNPYNYQQDTALTQLLNYAKLFNIDVDIDQLDDQSYLNYLHTLYENGFDGKAEWLLYHEAIHMFEAMKYNITSTMPVNFSYGIQAGMLDKKYEYAEVKCQTKIRAGDCYVSFSELGKTPYIYWRDGEADDLDRLCQLAKPYLRLTFKISVSLTDVDFMPADIDEFNKWFSKYKDAWCQHWQIPDWTPEQIIGNIPVGHIDNVADFTELLKNKQMPTRLGLVDA